MLAERNEMLVRERDQLAQYVNKTQETAILHSLDQVRAAVDRLRDRMGAIEKRFPAIMQGLDVILAELHFVDGTKRKPPVKKAGRR